MKKIMELIIVGVAFYSILLGVVVSEIFQSFFILIVSNVILDYFYEIFVASHKITSSMKFRDGFNSDYFDLYWNLSKNRIQLLLNLALFSISFKSFFSDNIDIIDKFLFSVILFVFSFIVWIILLHVGKNQKIIFDLMMKKQLNYSAYTSEEIKLINNIKHKM
ncbi:hypothetical protein [Streptococcus sp. oral taxon 431]|jgi:hypothetical protein|uniref:hypothetical protein n=1 Tax=Streptococcus sp. oral taxon 431 TaxID=712633 RepID=UPI00356AC380